METPDQAPAPPPEGAEVPLAPPSRPMLALTILGLACAVALFAALAGFGSRWGIWHYRTGFDLLRWAAYGAVAVSVASVITLWFIRPGTGRRGFWLVSLALVLTLPVFVVPLGWRARVGDVPPIHDITT
ncbi:MAG: hypothetical protein LC667_07850, partial [Thioalkalivibrio sp.]|nr:hypothetical protein [Thioalkalivibrio sp.]